MKKEKQVKSYSRKTKSGKTVTVKAHTAKYDSAEDIAKEILKKKGAGSELEAFKKKGELDLAKIDAYKGDPNELSEKEQQAWQILTGNYPGSSEKKLRKMKSLEKVWAYADAKGKKKSSAKAPKETKSSDKQSLSQADFKAWYHWDMDSDPNNESAKRAEKCLKKKLGAKKYKELLNKETENYSSRGHVKSFKALSEAMEDNTAVRGAKKVKGAATAQKEMAKQMGATDAVKKFDKKISEAKSTIKSKSSSPKLTDDDIEDIELTRGQIKKIATRFGASERAVGSWFAGGNWRNETDKDAKEGAKLDKTIRKVLGNKVYEKASMDARMLEAVLKATKDTTSKKITEPKNTSKSKDTKSKNVKEDKLLAKISEMQKVWNTKYHGSDKNGGEAFRTKLNKLEDKYNAMTENKAKYSSALSKSSGGKKDPNADFMNAIKADISAPVKAKGKFALGDATLRKQKLRKVLKEMRSGSLDKKGAIKILGYDPSKK